MYDVVEHRGATGGGFAVAVEGDHALAHGGEVAELAERFAAGVVGRHALRDQAVDARPQVERELVVDVVLEAVAAERDAEDAAHGFPSVLEGKIGRWAGERNLRFEVSGDGTEACPALRSRRR